MKNFMLSFVELIRERIYKMSLYSLYDTLAPRFNHEQRVNGGKKRAATGKRDKLGRLMPNDITRCQTWTLDENHGIKAGKIRAMTAKRIKGRFTK